MADKEFGRVCQKCKQKGGDTFARMYYKPIDGKWLRLCGVCWGAVEQSRALDGAYCSCKNPDIYINRVCQLCGKPHVPRQ